jgi:MFS family permease
MVLNGSVLVFRVSCLASSFSGDLQMLTVLRFLTGLGLGAAMPNAVTLMSEYCPAQRRAMITNAMFCGFPLGAAFGGFLAAWMIPQWGLAQRAGARRGRAACALGADGVAPPRVGAIHGGKGSAGGAHSCGA